MKKKSTFVVIRPSGAPLILRKVRPFFVIVLIGIICAGFAGYFIPFSQMRLDIVEQNQKRNFAHQNSELKARTRLIREELLSLKKQAEQLEEKRKTIVLLTQNTEKTKVNTRKKKLSPKNIDELLQRIDANLHVATVVAGLCNQNPAFFSRIPIAWPIFGAPLYGLKFGINKDPFTGENRMHNGIDFVGVKDVSVYATGDGRVARTENDPVWGVRITIEHQFGFTTVYAHLGKAYVQTGNMVRRGDIIGAVGASGLATGPHVHYEIWRNEKAVDPAEYLIPRLDPTSVVAQTADRFSASSVN